MSDYRSRLESALKEWNLHGTYETQSEQIDQRIGFSAVCAEIDRLLTPRPYSEWHEDIGCVLWWMMPICEPPYCGGPDCSDWPYSTGEDLWWTPIDGNAVQHRFDAALAVARGNEK